MSFDKKWCVWTLAFAALADGSLQAEEILWRSTVTGQLATWAITATGGTATGVQVLSRLCVPSNGCTSSWKVVGAGNFSGNPSSTSRTNFAAKNCATSAECIVNRDILWHDPVSGELQEWLVDLDGTVRATQSLSLRCDAASGCSTAWNAVATGDFDGDGNTDVLWHNPGTGQLGYWLLDAAGHVTSLEYLTIFCGPGCVTEWKVVGAGDFNHDGHTDVLWENTQTREIGVWLLDGAAHIIGFQNSLGCQTFAGCASTVIAGVGDFNHDSLPDVLRFDPAGGQLVAWLLNSAGTVTGTVPISWTCSPASGCSPAWSPVAVMRTRRTGPVN